MVPDQHKNTCGSETTEEGYSHHDVKGVIGFTSSRKTLLTASFLSNYKIPIISTYATSDELVDATRFPYLVRMQPPDSYQSKLTIELLRTFGWSHVTVFYSEGSYGEFGGKIMVQRIKEAGLCIALEKKLASTDGVVEVKREMERVYRNHPNSRVMIVIPEDYQERALNQIMRETKKYHGHFIFIGFDAFNADVTSLLGSIEIEFKTVLHKEFYDYYSHFKPELLSNNPWMRRLWTQHMCTWTGENESRKIKNETRSNCTEEDLVKATYSSEVYLFDNAVSSAFASILESLNAID